ncbi:MAG TPA: FtsX-like permease family protein [Acidimicrobiales bacterium]|nr:FtsX-like permease family protein [Acidimicrobiales bacterium]
MSWRDAAALAVKNLRRRFGRSVLTVLAVALAATLLTALVTIAGTARTRVLRELSKGGPLAGIKVAAAAPDPSQIDNDNARPGAPRDLDDEARRRITGLPDVASVVPVVASQMLVVAPDPPARADVLADLPPATTRVSPAATPATAGPTSSTPTAPSGDGTRGAPEPFNDSLVGTDLSRAEQLPITVVAGRLPAPGSLTEVAVTQGYLERIGLTRRQAQAVVGTEVGLGAPRVFQSGGRPRFRARWVRATVVGVVAQEAAPGQLLGSIEASRQAREWTAAGGSAGRLEVPTSPYTGLFVVARGLDRVSSVRAEITDIGYSTSAPENLIASVQRYLRVVEIVLGAIGLIALVIASLGITNALLASVRERRREIGVLKAIGARDRDVLRVFLLDASVLGFVGGVLGTAGGFAAALGVSAVVNRYLAAQGLARVELGLPVPILAASVLGSTLLALAAGALPARRAARLPARVAMEAT